MEEEKIIALAKSADLSSVLLAFELNDSLEKDTILTRIDAKMNILTDRTIIVKVNQNKMIVKEDNREIGEEEADEMREMLMNLNPAFYKFPFVEEFLRKRYNTQIVFRF